MNRYRFLVEAEAEYLETVRFYEEQRTGLGEALIYEFEHVIELIAENPEAWQLQLGRAKALSLSDIGMSIIAVIATMQNMRPIEAPKRRAQKAYPTGLFYALRAGEALSGFILLG